MPNETNVVSLPKTCNIRLYRYYGEPNKLYKHSLLTNFDGTLRGVDNGDYLPGTMKTPLDFISPTFFIESDKGFPWNYLRFQDTIAVGDEGTNYGVKYRYYFITSITCLNAGIDGTNTRLYKVECNEDVLQTYNTVIKKYGWGFVDRNEFMYSQRIVDDKIVIEEGMTVSTHAIPNEVFNDGTSYSYTITGFALGKE